VVGYCEHRNEPSGSIKGGKFLETERMFENKELRIIFGRMNFK
jgi:hypothetical protein